MRNEERSFIKDRQQIGVSIRHRYERGKRISVENIDLTSVQNTFHCSSSVENDVNG